MAAKTKRLGRGLGALISDESDDEFFGDEGAKQFREVEIHSIRPNPFQPREEYNTKLMEELKNSIAEKGVIQPITVREKDRGYELIAGERRLRAVRELGYDRIPAFIMEVETDDEMLELALIENIQREDLNPIDVARGYHRLIEELHLTQEQVAQKVGKERSTVTNFLRLLKLPPEIQESLRKAEISMGHARALLGVENAGRQLEIWEKTVQKKLSVRDVEAHVRKINQPPKRKVTISREKSPYIEAAEEKLREVLATKVKIYPQKKGGKIEIEYYSKEELERILEILQPPGNDY
ncbi:chromosome-partitioning protein Spo0J [bacterium BMS3Abin05]|nr:chromosome-partitioning protein Spo0J [bacterium BMS3Abin05]HDZ10736.1 ParB/RepB/Spo0J family partition protein [Bacteroidota bacterium]